ncbi:hatching enzyme 1.2-like [Triplophysa rosa]|uniref:hatching enzyme 1.2-like n=1 Tax=Triplophysa rosa TaxID=992332 RepID=UPI00254632B3|nr:hatching enzyme 1.2-like [Triplophysa rosa]
MSFVLVLLCGFSRAYPLLEKSIEDVFVTVPENVDITTKTLDSNNGSTELLIEGDMVFPKTRIALYCFNNNIMEVPYTVSSEFSYYDRWVIENAVMMTFNSKACIRFIPRSFQTNYISIENRDACYSSLGRTGGKQVVSLNRYSCVYHGIVQYELNHVLGFYHKQTRSDHDQYVKIDWEFKFSFDMPYNFQRRNTNNQNTPHDYGSIVHYGGKAFSVQAGTKTITPIPDASVEIGPRQEMSKTDILRINKLYEC